MTFTHAAHASSSGLLDGCCSTVVTTTAAEMAGGLQTEPHVYTLGERALCRAQRAGGRSQAVCVRGDTSGGSCSGLVLASSVSSLGSAGSHAGQSAAAGPSVAAV